jgi:hypothetical protein
MTTTTAKTVGHIITWQSPVNVTIDALRAALGAAQLDAKLARDLHDYHRLARTARSLARESTGTKRIARPIDGKRARQLTREQSESDGLRYEREAVLAIGDTGALTCDAPELAAAATAAYDAAGVKRSASDITRLIKRIVEHAGSDLMPLREQGGVYFVPEGHAIIGKLRTLLQHIGGSLRTFDCTIGHGSDESIASVVSDYLLSEIESLRASVAELDSDARADVKARRIERLGELRGKMAAYATLLSASAERVQSALSAADIEIVTKLSAPATVTA